MYDVAIIGGGPAGSTVGSLLRKYNPRLKVLILERETFPRDHVGESLLPVTSSVLDEMGVWNDIEAADFPVKIGATYRWGRKEGLWDFEFIADGKFKTAARPAKFEGQRTQTAFQVDRSIYDKILLDHSRKLGCEVRQNTAVKTVKTDGDKVTGLVLKDDSEVTARYYVDASGHAGIVRRTMKVEMECPTTLKNIAIWDYWRNADWAVSIGVGGTRIQVLSLPYGWLWFIPVGPDRTSIGLVVPARYYKEQGIKPEELYCRAVESDELIQRLTKNATRENSLETTNDWSFVSEKLVGENWFLAGEAAGFADPILSAGVSLAHLGARDIAYSILALDRKDYEPEWIKDYYCSTHRYQIKQHMRFADFWYTSNGVFSDLKDEAQRIAQAAGLELTADRAWQWLGQGGFIDRNGATSVGGYGLQIAKQLISSFTGDPEHYEIVGKTHFKLNLEEATKDWTADFRGGRIHRRRMYRRENKILPMTGMMGWVADFFKEERSFEDLATGAGTYVLENNIPEKDYSETWGQVLITLEALVSDGWIISRSVDGHEAVKPFESGNSPYWHRQAEAIQ